MHTHSSLYPQEFRAKACPKKRRNNRRTVTVPERVGPHVQLVFSEMARLSVGYQEIEDFSGVRRATCKAWRRKNAPSLESLTAVLGFLGWDYVPVPSLEVLSPTIAGEITTLALKLRRDIPTTWAAVIAVGVEQALLNMTIAEKGAVLEALADRVKRTANDNTKRTALAR